MADYLTDIKVGNTKYYISASGKDVFFSSSRKDGGHRMKGVKCINNELKSTADSTLLNDFQIAGAIKKSL